MWEPTSCRGRVSLGDGTNASILMSASHQLPAVTPGAAGTVARSVCRGEAWSIVATMPRRLVDAPMWLARLY